MGYMRHHAILVTSWDREGLAVAHAEATRLFGSVETPPHPPTNLVSPIIRAVVNDYGSFFVAPDGSKEGWPPSDRCDALRAEFVTWLHSQAYSDGSSRFGWALVQFGDEDGDQRVLLASNQDPVPASPSEGGGRR